MSTVIAEHLYKSFGDVHAVQDVSFTVEPGEILGMLGPNGAGKTTTIRMVLGIFAPDHGKVRVFGGPISPEKHRRIGYMPEERGLYQDERVDRVLLYLARLKGLSRAEARRRLNAYLERFDLAAHATKKVRELSKGMQQKAQLIATLIHEPDLLIVDEPFAGLDPVNTQMVKDLLLEMRDRGTSIVMSTHQMYHAEHLCDRILLIDHGQAMLYGDLKDIQRRFSGHAVILNTPDPLPDDLPGVDGRERHNGAWRLTLSNEATPQSVLQALVARGVTVEHFQVAVPPLEDIFIQVVQSQSNEGAR